MPRDQVPPAEAALVLRKLRRIRETRLQSEVIHPLLEAIGATHIQIVHGASERGKDFVYLVKNSFGDHELTVCQVKSQKLTGRADSLSTSAIVALNQLIHCRKTSVLHPISGTKELPRNVVFITTYPLPDAPLADANPLLIEVKQHCTIIPPEKLVDLLAEHVPEMFNDMASPGRGAAQSISAYVSAHHEAAAFGLTRIRKLDDFFVTLGVAHTGTILDFLARGALVARDARSIEMFQGTYRSLNSLYSQLPAAITSAPLIERANAHNGRQHASRIQKRGARPDDKKSGTATRAKRLDWVSVRRVRFRELLERLSAYIARAVQSQLPAGNPGCSDISHALDVLAISSELVKHVAEHIRGSVKESSDNGAAAVYGLSFPSVDPTLLVRSTANLCIVGGAGAGKTCLARAIARRALEDGKRCIYFPCSRIQDPEAELTEEIHRFLRSIGAVAKNQSLSGVFDRSDLIVLDGCDEAASFSGRLGEQIGLLAWRGPLSMEVELDAPQTPWLPPELEDVITSQETRSGVRITISGALPDYDFARIIAENRGTTFYRALVSLRKKAAKYRRRIIVTSREARPLSLPRGFDCVSLLQFDDEQMQSFFRKWFEYDPDSSVDVWQFLSQNVYIKDVCRTPMTATLVAALHESGYELPQSRAELYGKRFSLLLDGWDRARGVRKRTRVHSGDKLHLLARLALQLHQMHRRRFTIHDLERIEQVGFGNVFRCASPAELLDELARCDNVVVPEGGGEYSLGHLSHQEYLAALELVHSQDLAILQNNFFDPWWHQVLVFYAGITGDVQRLLSRAQAKRGLNDVQHIVDEMLKEARYTPQLVKHTFSEFQVCDDIADDDTESSD